MKIFTILLFTLLFCGTVAIGGEDADAKGCCGCPTTVETEPAE